MQRPLVPVEKLPLHGFPIHCMAFQRAWPLLFCLGWAWSTGRPRHDLGVEWTLQHGGSGVTLLAADTPGKVFALWEEECSRPQPKNGQQKRKQPEPGGGVPSGSTPGPGAAGRRPVPQKQPSRTTGKKKLPKEQNAKAGLKRQRPGKAGAQTRSGKT